MQRNTIKDHQQIIVENVLVLTFKYVYRADFILSTTTT